MLIKKRVIRKKHMKNDCTIDRRVSYRTTLIILFLSIIAVSLVTQVAYSAEVWSDDFDDQELEEWTTEVLDWDLFDAFTGESAEFDLSEGTLKAPGDTPGNIWYLANHNSTVEYGEWSFDVNVVDNPEMHFYVFLMTDDWAEYPYKSYSYDLIFITQPDDLEPGSLGGVVLFKRDGWSASWDTMDYWSSNEAIFGWHHVKVTRNLDGVFDVYFDDGLIIHVEDDEPQSGMFNAFRFEACSGPELDNIVVSDLSVEEPEPEQISETEEESPNGGIPGFPILSITFGLLSFIAIFYFKKIKIPFF